MRHQEGEGERQSDIQRTQLAGCAEVSPPREFRRARAFRSRACVRVQSRSSGAEENETANGYRRPLAAAQPIRAERELREGGTRCSFAYIFRGIYYSVCKYVAKMISLPRGRRRSGTRARARVRSRWMLASPRLLSRAGPLARSREVEPEGKGAG